MNDENNIIRFVEAQENPWNGYIFPQLRGLGHSRRSHFYGIADRKEAEYYLAHPILGSRLREVTEALLENTNKSAVRILGDIDAQKVKSCMTLFDSISPNDIFSEVLASFYKGERDPNSVI